MPKIGYIVIGQKSIRVNDSSFEFTSMSLHEYATQDRKERWLDWSYDENAPGNLQGFDMAKMYKTRKGAKNAIAKAAPGYICQIVRIYY